MKDTAAGYVNFCQQEKRRLMQICPYLTKTKASTILKRKWRQLTLDEKQVFQQLQQKEDNQLGSDNTGRFSVFEFTDELETTAEKDIHGRKQTKHNGQCYEIVVISDDESIHSKSEHKKGKGSSSVISTSVREQNDSPSLNHPTTSRNRSHGSTRKRKKIVSWTWNTSLRRHRPQRIKEQEDPTTIWQRLWTSDEEHRTSVHLRENIATTHQTASQSPLELDMKQSLFEKYNECYELFPPPVPYS